MDFDAIVSRSAATPLTKEKVSNVALTEPEQRAKSATDFEAEHKRHKANSDLMNKTIRDKMGMK